MKVKSTSAKIGDWIFVLICVLVGVICLVPMLNLLAKSLSSTEYLVRNEIYLWPKGLNVDAYATVLKDPKYIRAFFWTVFLTIVCTLVSLTMTILCAYPLIFDKLKGRGIVNVYITITMFFNAGTIPNYLLMKNLGLLDNPLVLIIPSCLSVYNMIIMRSFFYGIPDSLRESAEIDGATFFQILVKIYVPLSKPVMATLALFYAVGRWNGFSDTLYYISDRDLQPLQLKLYNLIKGSQSIDIAVLEGNANELASSISESIESATIIFATLPILCVYPFVQRYFVQGVTMGAVKG